MPSPRQKKASLGCAWVVAATISTGTGAFLAPPSSRGCCSRRSSSIQVQRVGSPRHTSPWSSRGVSRVSTRLNGVKEWKATQPGGEGGTREIGFLPFPVEDVMCPGETKALHLYEARFLALFENAIREHGGCVGGAIFVDDGVLVRVGQLCDIVAWEREEVGVSVALRCVGRVEITDVTGIDPYITATVREVRDSVGEAPEGGEEESNDVVSSDVFSLHRQCAEIEAKMAAVSGVGWEGGASGGGSGPSAGAGPNRGDTGTRDDSWVSSSPTSSRTRRVEAAESLGFFGIDEEEGDGEEEEEENDDQGEERGGNGGDDRYRSRYSEDLFGENGESSSATASEEGLTGAGDGNDLMSRFQRGGGELDLSQLGAGWASGLDAGGRGSAAGEDGGGGVGGGVVGGNGIDTFGGEMFVDLGDDEEEDEDEDDEEEEGQGERGLEDLLWGHESWAGDGFDVSLEEQVEAMNDSLQADLMVSLDEKRGGLDAASFGSPFAPNGNSGSSSSSSSGSSKDSDGSGQSPGEGQGPWGGVRTIAELIAASASLESGEGTEGGEGGGGSGTDGRGEGSGEAFLWGCSSRQEERNQLVSFVSLGCFDPSARLQSLIITSTGDRLRMARDALAERLKVLVAKSALSQLGD